MCDHDHTIPFLAFFTTIRNISFWDELGKTASGRLARKLLISAESGISPKDAGKEWDESNYCQAIQVLVDKMGNTVEDDLKDFATVRRLKDFASEIDWMLVVKAYPCLAHDELTRKHCETCRCPCKFKNPMKALVSVLGDQKILHMRGGIYFDRLITAKSLGVPWDVIEKSPRINTRAILKVLAELGLDPNLFLDNSGNISRGGASGSCSAGL